jgi:aminopeptidase N
MKKEKEKLPTVKYRKDYELPAYLVDSVDLHIELGEEKAVVTCKSKVRENPDAKVKPEVLILNGQEQVLKTVKVNDELLISTQYKVDSESLTLSNLPATFDLEVQSEIKPQENTELMGLYKSNDLFCTQCEPEGFRKIIYSLDRSDVLSSYTTTIVADKKRYPTLLSNGNLVAKGDLDDGRHWAKWQDPFKKPCYLFAMVAGDLDYIEDHFITCSGRKVILRIFSEKGNQDKCEFSMSSLKKAMRWDEENYGREYDLDIFMIVAVSDFNVGAMENKGLNLFNAKYILAKPETATDVDYGNIDVVVAHEYFHNWSGDRVTCRDWFQLSLKEGFTVFRDQSFSEDIGSAAIARINEVQRMRTEQFSEDAGPLAHPIRPDSYIGIDNFYTRTVYEKGAEVVRMLRILLGAEKFRKGTDLYFDRFDGQAVTCDDFVKAMEDASGVDLSQFRLWYSQAGTPELHIISKYDEKEKTYSLTVKQSCPATPGQSKKSPMQMPLAMGLLNTKGNELSLQLIGDESALEKRECGGVLNITQPEQTFVFADVCEKPIPSLLRGFSAPVKLYYDYSDAELIFLMEHDFDAFTRWEAGQVYASNIILEKAAADDFIAVLKRILLNKNLDKALIAQMLIMPAEIYLTELVDVVDVDAIHVARENLRQKIARELKEEFMSVYRENSDDKLYKYDVMDVARRSLKNGCLNYLMILGDSKICELCMQQFKQAKNMTDKMAALTALANTDCSERNEALAKFYQDYENDPLVIDKWFMVQAISMLPDTLRQVEKLSKHPAFNIKNPNRVYSLLRAFAGMNQVRFHDITGEGYGLLADQILQIDTLNTKVAARLVDPLTTWKKFDTERQGLMKQQLERMLAHDGLSKDVYEKVSKALGIGN